MFCILVNGGVATSHNCSAYCTNDDRSRCTACDHRCHDATNYHQTGQPDFGPFCFLCSFGLFFSFTLNRILHRIRNRAKVADRITVFFQCTFDQLISGSSAAC